ncbi:MAG TPA: hypothetical protein VES19_03910 [Candidatus Limnocylindrales bacterium]|nr:hypothetical protein [Candidatus Limnocylindrales bacterium]
MSPLPLVYVHGAGPQQPVPAFKHELDMLLFGRDMPSTRVGYYADVRWPPGGRPGGGLGAAGAPAGVPRQRRAAAIRRAAEPGTSARVAATEILDATLRAPGGAGALGAAGGPDEQAIADARKLVERLYAGADRVAAASAMAAAPAPGPRLALTPMIPDPIFRFVVGKFASDVLDYLFGPHKEAMRAPVRAALLASPSPRVVVCHSLGTIITYDVLAEPALAGLDISLLVTLGSPLAIANVQQSLRDGAGRPHPVPPEVRAWENFADLWDPVALDKTLRDDFDPPPRFAHDHLVNNPARDNHALAGYCSVASVRATIAAAAG